MNYSFARNNVHVELSYRMCASLFLWVKTFKLYKLEALVADEKGTTKVIASTCAALLFNTKILIVHSS